MSASFNLARESLLKILTEYGESPGFMARADDVEQHLDETIRLCALHGRLETGVALWALIQCRTPRARLVALDALLSRVTTSHLTALGEILGRYGEVSLETP